MGSLFEELDAREAAARVRFEELEAELAELSGKLELTREGLERLRIARIRPERSRSAQAASGALPSPSEAGAATVAAVGRPGGPSGRALP